MSFDEEFDVVVAGTGAAGCSAALGALHGGAKKVLICEKANSLFGGTTNLSGGGWLWCPNNRYLKEMGVTQKPEEIVALLKDLAYPGGKGVDQGDLEMIKTFAYEWPAMIETMQKEGFIKLQTVEVRDGKEDQDRVEALLKRKMKENPSGCKQTGINGTTIQKLKNLMPSYCAEHPLDLCPSGKVLSPSENSTSGHLKVALKRFEKDGRAQVRMNHEIVDLIFEGERVVGAVVKNRTNEKLLRIKAKNGVIFGSGGFSYSEEKKKKYIKGRIFGTCASDTNTGDLIDIAAKYGIESSGLDQAWVKQVVIPSSESRWPGTFFLNADSFIVVDRHGKRYADEKHFYQQRGYQMIENQQDRQVVFFLYDDRSNELYDGPVKSIGGPIPMEDCDEDCTVKGDNFNDLTTKINAILAEHVNNTNEYKKYELDPNFAKNLENEVKKFNGYAKKGVDPDFHRGENVAQFCWHTMRKDNPYPNKTMYPIDTSKMRMMALGLATLDTKGGPRINGKGQILKKGKPVPGLYGCGNCVRSFSMYSYPASGVTIASAMCFGFKSGLTAMNASTKL